MKNLFLIIFNVLSCFALTQEARLKGFVYLHEVDSTIKLSMRYAGKENFVGKVIDGYKKPVAILTKQAAQALKQVQSEVKKDGYCLVIYDAYRPQKAVNNFMSWSEGLDESRKSEYYPRVDKTKVFDLGYVAKRSSHSRGSTVDITIVKDGTEVRTIQEKERKLLDGFVIKILDDGTVDMGSSFDLFDLASHYENSLIGQEFKKIRTYLKNVMEKYGFKNYAEEWWHFTLKNEPYPAHKDSSYFDFDVE